MKLAIIGATGIVGNVMLKVIEERDFPYTELILAASPRSVGKKLTCKDLEHTLISVEDAIEKQPDIAIFSAGGSSSKKYAPLFAEKGTIVIDNSSAFRMDKNVPLVVPEINMSAAIGHKIIANPNCSTLQMVVALNEIHQKYGIERLVISTYQSVTGTGVKAVKQLEDERQNLEEVEQVYPHPIDLNCLPHGGDFEESGYTTEETKLLNETHKIFADNSIRITSTVVRVPVIGGHSMSVNAELKTDFTSMEEIYETLHMTEGVIVEDNPAGNHYPMPIFAEGKDEVFVGRIRRDLSHPRAINLWIVADNLRKGAATNAIQIAEHLV